MQMMYEIIAQELKSMHLESSHPQDYLNFYCLGNREALPKEGSGSPNQSCKNGDAVIILSKVISIVLIKTINL